MKKVTFVISHLGSDSTELVRILNENPRIKIHTSNTNYESVSDLDWLFESGHKTNNSSAIYGDHLLYNTQLSTIALYKFCQFIYVIRPARPSLNIISCTKGAKSAYRYYCFRLRRICEMAKRTPNALLVTWNDLSNGRAFSCIEKLLNLKEELKPTHQSFMVENEPAPEYQEKSQDSYERHLYYLKHLKHLVN